MKSVHPSILSALAPLYRHDGYVQGNPVLDEAIVSVGALAALQPWNEELAELERYVRSRTAAQACGDPDAAPRRRGGRATVDRRPRWLQRCCGTRRRMVRQVVGVLTG